MLLTHNLYVLSQSFEVYFVSSVLDLSEETFKASRRAEMVEHLKVVDISDAIVKFAFDDEFAAFVVIRCGWKWILFVYQII